MGNRCLTCIGGSAIAEGAPKAQRAQAKLAYLGLGYATFVAVDCSSTPTARLCLCNPQGAALLDLGLGARKSVIFLKSCAKPCENACLYLAFMVK